MNPLRILFVTSELNPLAKVGGLGDVAGALPRALCELGVDVRVALPKYDVIDTVKYPAERVKSDILVERCGKKETMAVWKTTIPQSDVPVYLIDNPDYIGNGGIYLEKTAFVGSFKEIERFLFFSLATLELFPALGWWPDIIHCQDWHTGIIPTLLAEKAKSDARYKEVKTLYTVHNLANQGKWNAQEINAFLCLPRDASVSGEINLMERGIRDATEVSTVSTTYAQEIQTSEYGEGLETLLADANDRLSGIVNGVDQDFFNPETDTHIQKRYTRETVTQAKPINKRALQKAVGLPENDAPIFGLVSRLTSQKGVELIASLLPELVQQNAQFVFLGTGEASLEKKLAKEALRFPKNIVAALRFDASLANQIYAGADLFLMPSRFEPCGLGQMIAMRYGTIPIVRRTGGLADTVTPYTGKKTEDAGWGFAFDTFSAQALKTCIKEAMTVYADTPTWQHLIQNAMAYDSSWTRAAKEYLALYNKIV